MAMRDIKASDLDVRGHDIPADLDEHKDLTIEMFSELLTENKLEDSIPAYSKFFVDIFDQEKRRRCELRDELKPCEGLLQKIYISARNVNLPSTIEDISSIKDKVQQIHKDLVKLIYCLRVIKATLAAKTYWVDGWERIMKRRVTKERFERRFEQPTWVCIRGLATEFEEFDNVMSLPTAENSKILEVVEEWTEMLLDELNSNCECCNNPIFSDETYCYLMHWRVAAVSLEKVTKAAGNISKPHISPKNKIEIKVASKGSIRQAFLALKEAELVPMKTVAASGNDAVVQTEIEESLAELEAVHPETTTTLRNNEVVARMSQPSRSTAKTDAQKVENIPAQSERSDGGGWTHCDPSMRIEKACGGHSILVNHVKKTKKKTRGKKQQAEVVEVQVEPEDENSDRRKWRFTNPTYFATIRQLFPLPGQKKKDGSISWDALRAALESPPLNLKLTRTAPGVSCTFERPAMDGLQKVSFVLHRPHSLKPHLERDLVCVIRARLKKIFGWEAEDFELVKK